MSEETIPQMREALEKANARVKELEKAGADKDQQLRVRDAREAFRQAGYNPKHGDLFANDPAQTGDITAEAVATYAEQWDLAPMSTSDGQSSSDEGDDTTDADDGTDALSGMDRSGTNAGEGGGGSSTEASMTRQQWMELQATDPVAASAALRQGRVLISASGNVRAGQETPRGGNPYEPQVASDA